MFNKQVKLTALLRSIERRSLPECSTGLCKIVKEAERGIPSR